MTTREPAVHVGELSLRVSGVTPDDAGTFGGRVARLVAEQLAAADSSVELGALHLRVAAPSNAANPEHVAAAVTRAILEYGR